MSEMRAHEPVVNAAEKFRASDDYWIRHGAFNAKRFPRGEIWYTQQQDPQTQALDIVFSYWDDRGEFISALKLMVGDRPWTEKLCNALDTFKRCAGASEVEQYKAWIREHETL